MSNEQLIKNLQFIGSHYPKIAPVQTVGVIADVCNAVLAIKTQEQEIERLEKKIQTMASDQLAKEGQVIEILGDNK